ncbi:MAG: hypothetical protein A3J58_00610 [Candidatus Sungbacteria bacterium RIFCSPHIGHO2_02_FULL_52_23]|uniref:Endonuclease/exonuclease/phosphatase domain-containing protein n=1 Tax=Candidatus Sungbacteria bacterium RIFCSPHIGHO2_02_FULL_52_23 TaxID=1802274 RepID=A0A1G2L0L7_9BACT|nr:MAG: hypothetical protein A3J58_00610 [Candidatus Sungbacteria bacterium RIFCSPHIGHO2_02_FULL_52_23]
MKAIYLNIWAGKVFEPLIAYIRAAAADTDFFCLQEVFDSPLARTVSWSGRADIFTHLKNALPEFTPFFSLTVENFDGDRQTDFPMLHGNVIFARKEIPILSHGDLLIAGETWAGPGTSPIFPHKLQYVRIKVSGMLYTIASVHGTAFPGSKADTPERIAQSQKIADFLADEKGRKILGGDFNLMPDTESVSMIERTGMRNLIKEYGITDTRGRLSHAQYTESQRQYFADFAFTSPDVLVKNFTVPQVEISDHLPLVVEWT